MTGSSLQSNVTTTDGDVSIDSIVTKPLTSSRLSCDTNSESDINAGAHSNETHPLLNDSRITADSNDDILKSEVTIDKVHMYVYIGDNTDVNDVFIAEINNSETIGRVGYSS